MRSIAAAGKMFKRRSWKETICIYSVVNRPGLCEKADVKTYNRTIRNEVGIGIGEKC